MGLAIATIGGLTLLIGVALAIAMTARRKRVDISTVTDAVDALLPQTQCGQCGYDGCRPYAHAIAAGEADINQCPPGGIMTIRALADLLGREVVPLDPRFGIEKPREVALIDEDLCIGCKKCILACPVDAIVGAPKLMHTVVVAECTGCELCVAPCPVDCIDMVPLLHGIAAWQWDKPTGIEGSPGRPLRAADDAPAGVH